VAEGGEQGQERTEEPTEKRKQDAREKGQVSHSREASTVIIFLAALGIIFLLKDYILQNMLDCMAFFFRFDGRLDMSSIDARIVLLDAAAFAFRALGPLMGVVFVAAWGSNVLQFGFLYSSKRIEANFDRLNPVSGFKRIFSLRQLVEGLKSIIKLLLIGVIVYLAFRREMAAVETMVDEAPRAIFDHITRASLMLTWKASIFLVALAVLDFGYQRFEFSKSLRMSRQELKDELKEMQGDPLIKQRIRQIQAERARNRMMAEVPKASVVVTNPTHLAVALQYERDKMGAPKVVAKGAGYIAEKIKEIARRSNVPVVEDKPVARILFKTVKIGHEVPVSLYKAIAGILAFVYKTAKNKPRWV